MPTNYFKVVWFVLSILAFANPLAATGTPFEEVGPAPAVVSSVKTVPVPVTDMKFGLYGIGLFAANDAIGNTIRRLTGGHYASHVGVILWDKRHERTKTEGWYTFESTGTTWQVRHLILPQVQINPWENIIDAYDGGISIRPFRFAPDNEPSESKLGEFIEKYLGTAYEKNIKELVESLWGDNKADDTKSMFCSELVAFMMMELGLLEKTDHANNFLPVHFETTHDQKLIWRAGIALEPQQELKVFNPRRCPLGKCVLL